MNYKVKPLEFQACNNARITATKYAVYTIGWREKTYEVICHVHGSTEPPILEKFLSLTSAVKWCNDHNAITLLREGVLEVVK